MDILGYIRFSFFGRTDIPKTKDFASNSQSLLEDLYAPKRMENRFRLFEKICLPSLRAQTDQDFKIIILSSDVMPDTYKTRLLGLVADVPQATVFFSDIRETTNALKPITQSYVEGSDALRISFRLDDDDAVSKDFIATLRNMGADADPLTVLTQSKGAFLARRDGETTITPRFAPFHSVGWAITLAPDDLRTPLNFAHTKSQQKFRSVIEPRKLSHVYCSHDFAATFSAKVRRKAGRTPKDLAFLKEEKATNKLKNSIDRQFPLIGYDGFVAAFEDES